MGISEFITQLAVLEAEESPDDEQRIRNLMEIATESLCRFSEACVKAGAGIVQCARFTGIIKHDFAGYLPKIRLPL